MKKILEQPFNFEDHQSALRIHVTPSALRDLCLSLQLLQEDLIETFVIVGTLPSERVEIAKGAESSRKSVQQGSRRNVTLSARDLDYARHFFMRYYRDGFAEVDHIDIQIENGDYVTFLVEESAAPVSAEEAKRRLGM